MTIRHRINIARKLDPQLCLPGVKKSIWGMRTVSDPSKNVQVEVHKGRHITSVNSHRGRVVHSQYLCEVHRVTADEGWVKYYGPHALEYAVASIVGEAARKQRKIIFYQDLKSVMLKKKIQDVSMIEIVVGKERIWGVVYNELT